MRGPALYLSILAFLAVTVDFFLNTRGLIRERTDLRAELANSLSMQQERLQSHGTPLNPAQLKTMSLRASEIEKNRHETQQNYFQAVDLAGYLQPEEMRFVANDIATTRVKLEELLLQLGLEFPAFPGLRAPDLGLHLLSVNVPLPSGEDQIHDQLERALLARWIMRCLTKVPGCRVQQVWAQRNEKKQLQVELRAAAPLADMILFSEQLLGLNESMPPRQLDELEIRRFESHEWTSEFGDFAEPPFSSRIAITVQRPPSQAFDERESTSTGGGR